MVNRFYSLKFRFVPSRIIFLFWLFGILPCITFAQTSYKVETGKGTWSVTSALQKLDVITTSLNGKNILLNAKSVGSVFSKYS